MRSTLYVGSPGNEISDSFSLKCRSSNTGIPEGFGLSSWQIIASFIVGNLNELRRCGLSGLAVSPSYVFSISMRTGGRARFASCMMVRQDLSSNAPVLLSSSPSVPGPAQ